MTLGTERTDTIGRKSHGVRYDTGHRTNNERIMFERLLPLTLLGECLRDSYWRMLERFLPLVMNVGLLVHYKAID